MSTYQYGVTRDQVDQARNAAAAVARIDRETSEKIREASEKIAALTELLAKARAETDHEIERREEILGIRYPMSQTETIAAANLMLPKLAARYPDTPELQAARRYVIADDRAAMAGKWES